jgi:TRAP-type uncharacterized transport system substrate-binding protein
MKLLLLYRRRWWLFYLPVLLCAFTALWWSATRWKVLAPAQVVIAAGSKQDSYSRLAQRYGELLERMGLRVEIVYADTQKGSLDRLSGAGDAAGSASVGFAHGIYASTQTTVRALAVVGQEPVWVFSSMNGPSNLTQAKGLRIAAGPATSSSFKAAKLMLAHAGIKPDDVRFEPLNEASAANALIDGKVDMVFLATGEDSQDIQQLTRLGGIQLLGIENAAGLSAQEPYLQPLLLPQGAMELRGDVPPRDLTMMSLQTHLVVRPDLHPALQRALLDAAVEIHELPTFLQRQGQFPSFRGSDFPLSATAKAYSHGARPWIETLLPYGKAQFAELVIDAIIPIVALTLIVLAWIPKLFDWRINAALNHFYGELKFLENEMDVVASSSPIALRGLLEKLDTIEQKIIEMDLPEEYSDRWYTLREHLAAAQDRMLKLRSR